MSLLDQVFVAFDFETTGLNPKEDRITEIGAVKFKGNTVLETYSALVNPLIPIPDVATRISGITNTMVQDRPDIKEILPDYLSFLEDYPLIAHNAGFDAQFLKEALVSARFPWENGILVDSKQIAYRAYPGLNSYSLQNLAEYLGIKVENAHRAEDDARVCKELFVRCVEKLEERHQFDWQGLLKKSRVKIHRTERAINKLSLNFEV